MIQCCNQCKTVRMQPSFLDMFGCAWPLASGLKHSVTFLFLAVGVVICKPQGAAERSAAT